MLQGLSDRLSKAIEQKRLKGKFENDFRAVDKELQSELSRLVILESKLEKEKIDVQRLEQISLTYLFYSALGSREQQLEKERQEFLFAQLSYQQNKSQIKHLELEKDRLSRELNKLIGAEQNYETALSEKEVFLRLSNHTKARELLDFSEEFANLTSELREITEAIDAGKSVLEDLELAIKSLESAEDWGTWDLLGGGFISSMIKHSRIDDARTCVDSAQKKISNFKRELADVQKDTEIQIDMGVLATFADFFFDGLIADWIVQSRIEDSLAQVNNAKNIIDQAIKNLASMKESAQNRVGEIKEKRALLIEHA